VLCPLDCEYLREARKHEKRGTALPDLLPNLDIRVTQEFLESHAELLDSMVSALERGALQTEGLVDLDARDALAALIRTYRTLATGLQYETRPENRLAARLYDALQEAVAAFRSQEAGELGIPKTRDSDVLGVLVFIQHFELDCHNGRQRGRAFIDALHGSYAGPPRAEPPSASPLIFT
jgi:hypothetical protein